MRKITFQKHLDQLTEEDLRKELLLLFEKIDEVKQFYKMELGNAKDKEKFFEKSKKLIASKYSTKSFRRPRRPRIQKVNTILRDIRKTVIFDFEMIDIYLFTVETALGFMLDYRYQSAPLYNNVTKCFEEACKITADNIMQDEYVLRMEEILSKSRYILGLYKELDDIYSTYQ